MSHSISSWLGFDQRKICPQCGDYQTHVAKYQQTAEVSIGSLAKGVLYTGLSLLLITMRLFLGPHMFSKGLWTLLFVLLVGGVILGAAFQVFGRKNKSAREQPYDSKQIGYRLTCRNCGYQWRMTTEEWEMAGQREREELTKTPAYLPQKQSDSVESRIEWKPPNPGRVVFIVITLVVLLNIAALSAYGVVWFLTHPNHSYAPIIGMVAFFADLLVILGIMVVFEFKFTKVRVISFVLILLLGVIGFIVRFLLK